MTEFKHQELTKVIIGCAMTVHNELGNGFPENIYQRSLAIELQREGLAFQKEIYLPIFYREQNVGSRRADFLVEGRVILELKAITELTTVHHAQIINYLKAYRIEIGLLLNFGFISLEVKRFIKTII